MNETSRLAKRYACIEYLLGGGEMKGTEGGGRREKGKRRWDESKIKSEKGME